MNLHGTVVRDGSTDVGRALMHEHGGLSWLDWVRQLAAVSGVPEPTDEEADWLLWEETAYPVAGMEYVRDQLLELFARQKEESVTDTRESGEDLEIHDPVDDLPAKPRGRRVSKWDAVIDQANEHVGRWIPVTKPPSFNKGNAKWLCARDEGIVVEVRGDKVYVRCDPEEAARRAEAGTSGEGDGTDEADEAEPSE